MGINNFRRWLNKYAKSKNARDTYKINPKQKFKYDVASLFIDVNGLLHNVAGQYFAYKDDRDEISRKKHIAYLKSMSKEEREEEFFSKIFLEIFVYLDEVKPKEYLILAVDGVAPMAKITQQRKRRFIPKDSKDVAHNIDTEYDDEDSIDLMTGLFNSNAITPGTDFMAKLDYYMLHFLELNTKRSDFIIFHFPTTLAGHTTTTFLNPNLTAISADTYVLPAPIIDISKAQILCFRISIIEFTCGTCSGLREILAYLDLDFERIFSGVLNSLGFGFAFRRTDLLGEAGFGEADLLGEAGLDFFDPPKGSFKKFLTCFHILINLGKIYIFFWWLRNYPEIVWMKIKSKFKR